MYSWNSVKITRKIVINFSHVLLEQYQNYSQNNFYHSNIFRKGEKNLQGACCFTA